MVITSPTSPESARRARGPGAPSLVLGVIFPAIVVAIELVSRMCASAFFDPMPTIWHVLAVSFVPAGNLLVWLHLHNDMRWRARWPAFVNGGAVAIAAFYALLFLPLLPVALVAIAFGIGVFPFAPACACVAALLLRKDFRARHVHEAATGAFLVGIAAGLTFLLALDAQQAATRLGIEWVASSVPAQRERGLALLRTIGDDSLLLRLCYDTSGRPTGLLSALVLIGENIWLNPGQRQIAQSPAEVREIYYRVHGEPFNVRPAPFENGKWSRFAEFQTDDDHGGAQVGGRLKGLSLASSRLDGVVMGDDAVSYLEWTFEVRNSEPLDREVRLQLALPPGGVVSRATLWINGEEREAAYGGREQVRAAYQRVAVVQRRDPLLVTTRGADRVLVQAFPVPRNGGTIKFKIGITAPLEIAEPATARLALPAIVDRNFSFAPEASHAVWIESKQALATSAAGLTSSRVEIRRFRVAGTIDDGALSGTRQVLTVERHADMNRAVARIGEEVPVVQEIAPAASVETAMMLVIDGSARLAGRTAGLIEALDAIPPGTRVGAIIAAEPTRTVAPAPWSEAQKQAVAELLRSASFSGGQDNVPALVEALQMLEAEPSAALLWIHGPQPVSFRGSAARLEQASVRLSRLPDVALYAVEPGPNEVLPDAPWAWSARSLPQTSSPKVDLAGYFARLSGQGSAYSIRRSQGQPADGLAPGPDHIARLWARDRVLELMRANPAHNRAAAVALATQYHLVTPISGAVVLETTQQYDESRLTPVTQATVPTVPEPQEWVLALIACAALLWLVWQTRQRALAA